MKKFLLIFQFFGSFSQIFGKKGIEWKPHATTDKVDLHDLVSYGLPVFQDNFNGQTLDKQKWQYDTGCEGFNDGMLNCFVSGTSNIRVNNGFLKIQAKVQNYQGRNFTSGRIHQRGPGFRQGVFAAKMKMPRGRQLFPAFWLLETTDSDCRYEEIDIVEYKGENVSTVFASAFFGRNSSKSALVQKSGSRTLAQVDLSKDFHEYWIQWTNEQLIFYVDQVKYLALPLTPSFWEQEGPDKIPCGHILPFDTQFRIILNLAVGGSFFGSDPPVTLEEAKNWPQPELVVDWIKIFQPFWALNLFSSQGQ